MVGVMVMFDLFHSLRSYCISWRLLRRRETYGHVQHDGPFLDDWS